MFFAGQIFKFVPFVKQYNFPLRVIGFLLLMAGAYFNGGLGVEQEYRARIEEMQKKIEIAEAKSKQENEKIVEKIVTETKIINQDTAETKYLIEQMKEQINQQGCELTSEAIDLYNEGMTGRGQ